MNPLPAGVWVSINYLCQLDPTLMVESHPHTQIPLPLPRRTSSLAEIDDPTMSLDVLALWLG